MKILFIGRGVINTQYAWALEKAGNTVAFYVRESKMEQYGSDMNLEILDARRKKKERTVKEKWSIVMYEALEPAHSYDLIFVSVNAEQLPAIVEYLTPRLGNATVLFFGNFWRDIRTSFLPLPMHQVVWGFPGAGGGIEGNSLHGVLYKSVQLGTFESQATKRELTVQQLFEQAGFKVKLHQDLQLFLKNHFISNAAMEVEVIKSGSFKNVASSRMALNGIGKNTKEMLPVLQASGTKPDMLISIIGSLPPKMVGLLMSMVLSPKGAPYAAIQYNNYPVGPAVLEIIAEAQKHNIPTPRLSAAASLLTK